MKTRPASEPVPNSKKVIIGFLYTVSAAIVLLGVFYSIYSYICHISFRVLNTNVPGSIFGAVVAYLGIRYFLSVNQLKRELYKSSSKFSWSNFKYLKILKKTGNV